MSATAGPATVESIDPANGELVETYEVFTEGQIDAALDLSHKAFGDWRRAEWSKRAELMNGVGRELRARGEHPRRADLRDSELTHLLDVFGQHFLQLTQGPHPQRGVRRPIGVVERPAGRLDRPAHVVMVRVRRS